MAVLTKNIRYKQLYCLYSKRTLCQLGPLKARDPDLESFLSKADQSQYGTASVNFKITNDIWQIASCTPEGLRFQKQFLTSEQSSILLKEGK